MDTYLCNASVALLKESWFNQVFHSKSNAKVSRTTILIHKHVLFHPEEIISYPKGRYVIGIGHIFSSKVILVNVYAPNFDVFIYFYLH